MKFRIILVTCIFIFSCNRKSDQVEVEASSFAISGFEAIANQSEMLNGKIADSVYTVMMDYSGAVDGFVIPSLNQNRNSGFIFKFSIENKSGSTQKFAYKLYYRNNSYRMEDKDTDGGYNNLAEENFYGSWEDASIAFKLTGDIVKGNEIIVQDTFRIVGNPREEERYYEGGNNQRWRRNPRVGLYSFKLVVLSEKDYNSEIIPEYISDIRKTQDKLFIDPFYYFEQDSVKANKSLAILSSENLLRVIASPDPGAGIWVYPPSASAAAMAMTNGQNCDTSYSLYLNAGFSQFFHTVLSDTRMENIPIIQDVNGDGYSKIEYNWNKAFIKKEELISVIPTNPRSPCETVYSDAANKKIVMWNPASKPGDYRKENTGVITRHGFTYGKYRVKAKLPRLLNSDNVWNGVTNAIWLINQSNAEWNRLRSCDKTGYMASYAGGAEDARVNYTSYSEIDFEILKNVPYCPRASFPPIYKPVYSDRKNIQSWNKKQPEEILQNDAMITVACTNWDMACPAPVNYGIGCQPVKYKEHTFQAHRWDANYRALTTKSPEPDAELFGSEFYYFEIEWKPREIIWRIGPSPEKMRVVAYMDDKITSVPNNQMLLIIDQEFHNTKWWPGAPYDQANIPFPGKDIKGEIYEVWIE